jgi:hypothetical protein
LPVLYNNLHQIVQTKDYVMILNEMNHDARIIRMGGTHLPSNIRKWMGDSIGRWEGDTLVVDTTNFTDKTNFRGPPATTRQEISHTRTLHVVERFTRVDKNTINYQFTVEDPATWTQSWSGEYAIRAFEGPIYEYACHEGNYGLANILRAQRVQDAQAAPASKGSSN